MKSAKLDSITDHFRDWFKNAPVIIYSVHLHGVHSEFHHIPNVVEPKVLTQGLHLPILADCEQGQTPEEALQWSEYLGPSHSVIILDEGEVAD